MPFVTHPLVKENTIEQRAYQETILAGIAGKSSLVVLPTGLGKTFIAAMLVAHTLEKDPDAKILVLAPTKPLVLQHMDTFSSVLDMAEGSMDVFTGAVLPEKRKEGYEKRSIIFATPQVIENDIISNRVDLGKVKLIILDEAHRAVGNYAYVYIAEMYDKQSDGILLGITASPGHQRKHIKEVMENIRVTCLHIEDETSPEVTPYIHEVEAEWIKLDFPKGLEKSRMLLKQVYEEKLSLLMKMRLTTKPRQYIGKKDLLAMGEVLRRRLATQKDGMIYVGIKAQASAVKLAHAIELLETQGAEEMCGYFDRMRNQKAKSATELLNNKKVTEAYNSAKSFDSPSPKLEKLSEIISVLGQGQTAIVFSQYRSTAMRITTFLKSSPGIRPIRFVGQSNKDMDEGLSQKKQRNVLDKFRAGEYNVLVATSVAEEGLDIPTVDLVVFFEPIPSEIRTIQRRGRTGRRRTGRVVVLTMKGTMDEAYYHVAREKEKKMQSALRKFGSSTTVDPKKKNIDKQAQRSLDSFVEKSATVVCDTRENPQMTKSLSRIADVSTAMLGAADYVIGDRIGIERKEASDFVRSLIDGRLFEQVKELKRHYEVPLLLIEGSPYATTHDISPKAIRNAILAIMVDFGVGILTTEDIDDSCSAIVALSRRELTEKKKHSRPRPDKKAMGAQESQVFVLQGFPNISATLAKRLLTHFGSLQKVLVAPKEKLVEVDGIGEKKADAIIDVLNSTYGD